MYENELWELWSESFPPFSNVVKLVPVQTVSVFVVAVIMANGPVGFPVSQMQEGLVEPEALDCFMLDYIDYCTGTGWFERKDGCQYDDQSEDGRNQWTDKAPQSKRNSTRSQSQTRGKESSRKQSECNYCGATPSHPKEN